MRQDLCIKKKNKQQFKLHFLPLVNKTLQNIRKRYSALNIRFGLLQTSDIFIIIQYLVLKLKCALDNKMLATLLNMKKVAGTFIFSVLNYMYMKYCCTQYKTVSKIAYSIPPSFILIWTICWVFFRLKYAEPFPLQGKH